ncbi:MAG: prepilin-type N-terminal cleavage/methylation domain-containing protein [Humidesulfovibrio sp.]|nr:prepilin-type N-terminal cleavage/methylation domain-containing protein [Humidesulfovibrio sp.]
MRTKAGFTLIELIAVIVLLGLIAIFAGSMFSLGAKGMLAARQAEENGQKADIALARIALELRDINGGPATSGTAPRVTASLISYTSSNALLPGSTAQPRTLAYDAANKRITLTVAGTAYLLLDGVSACAMSANTSHAPTFTVSFTLTNSSGTFSITESPRNSINTPASS